MMRITNYLFLVAVLCMAASCTSYKSFVNFNEGPSIPTEAQAITNFKPLKIQPNDILQINVISPDPVSVAPFNLSTDGGGGAAGYLVNADGTIDFPTIGKIELIGLEIEEVKVKIAKLMESYFTQPPIIRVRLSNFKVVVNGEIGSPGTFRVANDRLTVFDAITLAGDFTPYSDRDSVLIIREQDNMRSFAYVDFSSPEIFNSEYFYLQQNDVLYIRPTKGIVNSVRDPASRFLPWISAIVSITAILISLNRI
ncbi:MAG: polysaccharide biosynthesis/export family protein [Saprospiraceae bacterium]